MRTHRPIEGARRLDLYPSRSTCPACGGPFEPAYRRYRFIVSLRGMTRVAVHALRCASRACPQHAQAFRPEEEAALALPRYTFGLDVLAQIGQQRFTDHRTITEIREDLGRRWGVSISEREVAYLIEAYLALVQTEAGHDEALLGELRAQGRLLVAIDGIQPEKGNETLYLARDVQSGRVLAAANLLVSSQGELAKFLGPVKDLGVPVAGILSDKQQSLVQAVDQVFPGIPHQLCHFHYLRDAALPMVDADRAFRTELRRHVRWIRQTEKEAQEKLSPAQAALREVVLGFMTGVRVVMGQEGRYPLEPGGIELYEKLDQIRRSLKRCLARGKNPLLTRLAGRLAFLKELKTTYERLRRAFAVLHGMAGQLQPESSDSPASFERLSGYVHRATAGWTKDRPLTAWRKHLDRITGSFGMKLFSYQRVPGLPRTNNDLELFFGRLKKSQRRVTGRRNVQEFILRQGGAVAILHGLDRSVRPPGLRAAHPDTFQEILMALRRRSKRSQEYRARRDLAKYLADLERAWVA